MIEATSLAKIVRTQSGTKEALRCVTFSIRMGEKVAVVGPSGSGKSTLLAILGLLDRATGGRYLLNGEDVTSMPESQATVFRRTVVGFVFQKYFLIPNLSAVHNVEVALVHGAQRLSRSQRRERSLAALDDVGLAELARQPVGSMSGGEQQRVALARCIAKRPSLILADEPTASLDAANSRRVLGALLRHVEGSKACLLVASHDRSVSALADRIIELGDR